MSTNTPQMPSWVISLDDFDRLDGWTGGARPVPPAGYYEARLDTISSDEKNTDSFAVTVAFVSTDAVANGYTSKEFYHFNPKRYDNEKDERYVERCATNRGKIKGLLTDILALPLDYLRQVIQQSGGLSFAVVKALFELRKGQQALPDGDPNKFGLICVAFSTPPENALGGTNGTKQYATGDLMSREDWEKAKATGKPPEYRTRGGSQTETATQQAALPGSVTRLAAGGGTGAPLVVPAAGGGLPSSVPSFGNVPAAGSTAQAPSGVLPALPPGLGTPGR